MRWILLPLILLTACSQQRSEESATPTPKVAAGTFAGPGRDRLCLAAGDGNWRVGIVTYGGGNNNCTFRGSVVNAEHGMLVEAVGDPACKLLIESDGEILRVRVPNAKACEYYCGPTASLADHSFKSDASASPAVDFAGDPLC